ncbi:unnamed protein product, partial [Sphagnum tenellum]
MGRAPCCEKDSVKRGPWAPEEDTKLLAHIRQHGTGSWRTLPKKAGLRRCGKSCRLRWTNYLRPDLKHGHFTDREEQLIVNLHAALGSRWSLIAAQLPGRTDNDVKNYWNTRLKKKLAKSGWDQTKKTASGIADDANKKFDDSKESTQEAGKNAKESAKSTWNDAKDKANDGKESAEGKVDAAKDHASSAWGSTQKDVSNAAGEAKEDIDQSLDNTSGEVKHK